MATKRKRRIRSPHPGVVLLERTLPSGRVAWQARYRDPDTGKLRKPMLDSGALPTHEARRLWAIAKSKDLAKRRMDLAAGAAPKAARPFAEAVAGYVDSSEQRLRKRTLKVYQQGIRRLAKWAEREGLKTTDDLTQAKLAVFRDHLIATPRQAALPDGRRGERQLTTQKRSPNTVNCELRAVKTMLNAWRLGGLLPHVTRDAIGDALNALTAPRELPTYLRPEQLRKLLQAAQRHDAAAFAATRDEHAGRGTPGTTRRYEPIAPFTTFLLLTGFRRGEALSLQWSDVHLDALDHDGRKIGEIRLSADATKTKQARTIGLEVSPALRAMLSTMKLRAGEARYVFNWHDAKGKEHPYTADLVETARARLIAPVSAAPRATKRKRAAKPDAEAPSGFGAPQFDWQTLRSTCATYLTNAPGIFGNATAFLSAKQLGHSINVAERHYLGVHRGIPREARTLEAAMQIEGELTALGDARTGAALPSLTLVP